MKLMKLGQRAERVTHIVPKHGGHTLCGERVSDYDLASEADSSLDCTWCRESLDDLLVGLASRI
jgi:hypothetical protein